MMNRLPLLLLSAVVGLGACTHAPRPEFGQLRIDKQVDTPCARYDLDYTFLYIRNADRSPALSRIERALVGDFFQLDTVALGPEEASAAYEERLAKEYACTGDETYRWEGYFDTQADAATLHDRVLVYTIDRAEFTGGAHGMNWRLCACYRLDDGARLTLSDLFSEEGRAALPALIQRQIARDHNLSDIGEVARADTLCFFDPAQIGPTENFVLGDDALTFVYNPYEIACYAMGQVAVTLPYREVDEWMNPAAIKLLGIRH